MAANGYNSVDPATGTVTYNGASERTKGNHNNVPQKTDAYLDTDERGHLQASSLGGSNKRDNVVPQSADLNHGGYYSMERGERAALKNGSTIESEKIAYASNQKGNRPDAFIVNDTITYADGQVQSVHLSFSNLTNAEQESMNRESSIKAADMFDAQSNPGDSLRNSMSTAEYAQLMEETDASLPNIKDGYDEHIEISTPSETTIDWDFDELETTTVETIEDWDFQSSAEVFSTEMSGSDDSIGISFDNE